MRLFLAAIAALLASLAGPAAAQQVPNPMSKDGANAQLPQAQDNLGIPRTRSVMEFGAKCDGTTNDTAAIQAAINASQGVRTDERPILQFPHGECLSNTLTISGQIRIRGQGSKGGTKIMLPAGSTTPLFIVATAGSATGPEWQARIVFDDIELTSLGTKNDAPGYLLAHGIVHRAGTFRATIELNRVLIYNFPGYGIDRDPGADGAFYGYNSQFVGNQVGIHNDAGWDWSFIQSQVSDNVIKGIHLSAVGNNRFIGVGVYNNQGPGVAVYGYSPMNSWIGGSIDHNKEDGIVFNNYSGEQFNFVTNNFLLNSFEDGGFSDIRFENGSTGGVHFNAPTFGTTYTNPSSYNVKWADTATSRLSMTTPVVAGSGIGYLQFTNKREFVRSVNSVLEYGAKCNGTTDDTAALQAAINASISSVTNERQTLRFPAGDCLTGTLTIGGPINIQGEGQKGGTKLILKTGSAAPLLVVQTAGTHSANYSPRITINDIQLLAAGGNLDPPGVATAHGIDLAVGTYRITTELSRVMVRDFAGHGVHRTVLHEGPLYAYDSQFVANLVGLHNTSGPDWGITQSQVYNNLTKGIHLAGASNNSFRDVGVYSNGTDGLYVFGAANDNQWFGGSIDRNGQDGINFDGFTGRAFKFFGLNFVQNDASAGGFSDVKFGTASSGAADFVSPIFAHTFSGVSSYNLKWIGGSTSPVTVTSPSVGGGYWYSNFTNARAFIDAGTLPPKAAVASLPACSAAAEGRLYAVTDANSAVFNAAVAGGGANHVMAYCDGTGWKVH